MPDIMHLIHLDASPATVFNAISTAAGIRRWWTDDAEIESRKGGAGQVRFYGSSKVTDLSVRDIARPSRLVWDVPASFRPEWINTEIIFDLTADGEGTKLLFSHRGYPSADEAYALCTTGWGIYLGRLKALVEGENQ
jgi:uncharacterized protein YndB with AHSA1/START domain